MFWLENTHLCIWVVKTAVIFIEIMTFFITTPDTTSIAIFPVNCRHTVWNIVAYCVVVYGLMSMNGIRAPQHYLSLLWRKLLSLLHYILWQLPQACDNDFSLNSLLLFGGISLTVSKLLSWDGCSKDWIFKIQLLINRYLSLKSSWQQSLRMDVERNSSNTETQAPFNVKLRHANQGTYWPLSFLSKKGGSDFTKVLKDYTYIHTCPLKNYVQILFWL